MCWNKEVSYQKAGTWESRAPERWNEADLRSVERKSEVTVQLIDPLLKGFSLIIRRSYFARGFPARS